MFVGGCISRDSREDTVGQLETVGEIRLECEWGVQIEGDSERYKRSDTLR